MRLLRNSPLIFHSSTSNQRMNDTSTQPQRVNRLADLAKQIGTSTQFSNWLRRHDIQEPEQLLALSTSKMLKVRGAGPQADSHLKLLQRRVAPLFGLPLPDYSLERQSPNPNNKDHLALLAPISAFELNGRMKNAIAQLRLRCLADAAVYEPVVLINKTTAGSSTISSIRALLQRYGADFELLPFLWGQWPEKDAVFLERQHDALIGAGRAILVERMGFATKKSLFIEDILSWATHKATTSNLIAEPLFGLGIERRTLAEVGRLQGFTREMARRQEDSVICMLKEIEPLLPELKAILNLLKSKTAFPENFSSELAEAELTDISYISTTALMKVLAGVFETKLEFIPESNLSQNRQLDSSKISTPPQSPYPRKPFVYGRRKPPSSHNAILEHEISGSTVKILIHALDKSIENLPEPLADTLAHQSFQWLGSSWIALISCSDTQIWGFGSILRRQNLHLSPVMIQFDLANLTASIDHSYSLNA